MGFGIRIRSLPASPGALDPCSPLAARLSKGTVGRKRPSLRNVSARARDSCRSAGSACAAWRRSVSAAVCASATYIRVSVEAFRLRIFG